MEVKGSYTNHKALSDGGNILKKGRLNVVTLPPKSTKSRAHQIEKKKTLETLTNVSSIEWKSHTEVIDRIYI
jgi:hypothetical protein